MPLKLVLDNLDGLDDAHKALYVERDGKFNLDLDGLPATSAADAARMRQLVADAAKERRKAADLEAKMRKWEDLGKTDEEISALIAAEAARAQNDAEAKGQWETVKKQMLDAHAVEIKKLRDRIMAQETEIARERTLRENLVVDHAITGAIVEAQGDPLFLSPVVRGMIKTELVDGQIQIKVVDDKGTPRVNGKSEPITVNDLVAELRGNDRFAGVFKGAGQSGGGARPVTNGGTRKHNYTTKAQFKNERERADFFDQFGKEEYDKLPLS